MHNKRKVFALSAVAAAMLVVAGGLMASNMGFKINRVLKGGPVAGVSNNGTNAISLPYNAQVGIVNCNDLVVDAGGFTAAGGPVVNLQSLNITTNTYTLCSSSRTNNFPLVVGVSYRIRVSADKNYIAVGSHDPVKIVLLKGGPVAGVSNNGTNEYSYPYHSTAANCNDLAVELGGFTAAAGPVVNVQNLNLTTNTYTLCSSSRTNNFALAPGFGYRVRVSADKTFTPSHY